MQDSTNNENEIKKFQKVKTFSYFAMPHFEPVIIFTKLDNGNSEETKEAKHKIKIYDAEGEIINEVVITINNQSSLNLLEIQPLVASSRLNMGLRHGSLDILFEESENINFYDAQVFLVNKNGGLKRLEVKSIGKVNTDFLPIYYNNESTTYISFINRDEKEKTVKCKLVLGNRSPEIEIKVEANHTKIVSIWDYFSEVLDINISDEKVAYLKVSTKNDDDKLFYSVVDIADDFGDLSNSVSGIKNNFNTLAKGL